MKTTMDLPDELMREVKLRAVMQGRTIKDLVTEYLSQCVGMAPRADADQPFSSPMVLIGSRGLPVIRCASDAPATRMSVEELLKLEQETQWQEDAQRVGIPL